MKDILSAGGRAILEDYARAHVLIGFDFDGTLAPLSKSRDSVFPSERTVGLLGRLARTCPVAVVSGRSRADLAHRVARAEVRHVIGNHGLEPSQHDGECELWTLRIIDALVGVLPTDAGIEVENKRCSLSLHWANAADFSGAREAIQSALATLREPVRIIDGKGSLSVLKPNTTDKGQAMHILARQEAVDCVVYVGDDETDEDVFRSPSLAKLLGIRIGSSLASGARYYLPEQSQIDTLLELLIAMRSAS
jgi:trehalose 6-phosphate phosphatase